jgi:hypothetical protein
VKNLPHSKVIAKASLGGWLATFVLLLLAQPEWASNSGDLLVALALALFPYAVLFAIAASITFPVSGCRVLCFVAVLIGIGGFVLHMLCLDGSCMSGFVIILAPFYQLCGVGGAVLLALLCMFSEYIDRRVAERHRTNKGDLANS